MNLPYTTWLENNHQNYPQKCKMNACSCPAFDQNQKGTSSDYAILKTELPGKYHFLKTVLPWKDLHFIVTAHLSHCL